MTNRKDIADRVSTKWRDFGFPIDDHPEFQALLKLWINPRRTTLGGCQSRLLGLAFTDALLE